MIGDLRCMSDSHQESACHCRSDQIRVVWRNQESAQLGGIPSFSRRAAAALPLSVMVLCADSRSRTS
jgi:hypothetical protein